MTPAEKAADDYVAMRRKATPRVNPCEHEAFMDGWRAATERAARIAESHNASAFAHEVVPVIAAEIRSEE